MTLFDHLLRYFKYMEVPHSKVTHSDCMESTEEILLYLNSQDLLVQKDRTTKQYFILEQPEDSPLYYAYFNTESAARKAYMALRRTVEDA